MNHLLRSLAPVSDSGWELLDDEARSRLAAALAARKVVDFTGPHGWEHSASNLGRTTKVAASPVEGVTGLQRKVLPLVELRADFAIRLAELSDHDRGRPDVDLGELDEVAHTIAVAENTAVFHGWGEVGVTGIAEASPHSAPALGAEVESYPRPVAAAVELLLQTGIGGPYALALGREHYTRVVETAEHGGYPLLDHLRKILDGPVLWAPGVNGAVVVSLRGGDYRFESGQDFAIGYDHHDAETVHLYIEESFSFVVATPEAAVPLSP
ncbi:MAG TPA: family 1 encapsulin nanocompartment shell protein [Gaiellaceae bacterium]